MSYNAENAYHHLICRRSNTTNTNINILTTRQPVTHITTHCCSDPQHIHRLRAQSQPTASMSTAELRQHQRTNTTMQRTSRDRQHQCQNLHHCQNSRHSPVIYHTPNTCYVSKLVLSTENESISNRCLG